MIRRPSDLSVTMKPNLMGGNGTLKMLNFLDNDEMRGAGRLCAITVIPVGGSVGKHTHTGDQEIYFILEGTAKADDNGTECILNPGDLMWCKEGEYHAIENIGDSELKYVAVILYTKD